MESSAENQADKSHKGGNGNGMAKSYHDLQRKGSYEVMTAKEKGEMEDGAELDWDQYFMKLALTSASFSKASKYGKKGTGACIVNDDNRVLALGFNRMPKSKRDEKEEWENSGHFECHALINANLNKNQSDITGCTVYVTHYPCSNCARYMKLSGLKTVHHYYTESCVDDNADIKASSKLLGNHANHKGGNGNGMAKSLDDLQRKVMIAKKRGKMGDGAELDWDQYFMKLALTSASFSKASKYGKKGTGACIVNDDNRVLALGFNRMQKSKRGEKEEWEKSEHIECHALITAILNRNQNDIKGCKVYITHYPCSNCARYMKLSGLKTVHHYYTESCVDDDDDIEASKKLIGNHAKKYEETQKRSDKFRSSNERLSWNQYFMGIALVSAERSKDPKRQVGACIVNAKKRILGIGYNGMPDNIDDTNATWDPDTKETFVCHAELNAVLNRGANDITGCTLYVTYYPCSNCAKVIIQSGIKSVIYYDSYSEKRKEDAKHAADMLETADVSLEVYEKEDGVMKIKASTNEIEKKL